MLAEFRRTYPQVRLEVQLTNRRADLVAEGIDLAVRGRNPPDSGLVSRKLEDAELVIVGSPAYLQRYGTPTIPIDLKHHECIQFERPLTGQVIPWLLKMEEECVEVNTTGSLRITEDVLGLSTAARAGIGLAQTYRFIVEEDLKNGRLVEVMREFGGASRPFNILYPPHRHMPQRVRLLIEFPVNNLPHEK